MFGIRLSPYYLLEGKGGWGRYAVGIVFVDPNVQLIVTGKEKEKSDNIQQT